MSAKEIKVALKDHATAEKKEIAQKFFKTGLGQYGEKDVFIGVKTPEIRSSIKPYLQINNSEVLKLVRSKIHEERLAGLFIWVDQYQKEGDARKEQIYQSYCENISRVNNWDLVDLSAPKIIGPYLKNRSKAPLTRWARSDDLWERRIAIISTYFYIRQGEFKETLRLAKILLEDEHDLIHKAVGWMLREVGNRNLQTEEAFLKPVYKKMPRTMLRYAIEKFPEAKRQRYLKGTIR